MAAQGLLVLSAHYDDAVLSAGRVIAAHPGTVVATACSAPAPPGRLTDWDRASGFADGDDVMDARRREDEQSLATLGATARPLGLPDSQYLSPGSEEDRTAALREVVAAAIDYAATADPDIVVLLPLGIAHPDHVALRDAALDVVTRVAVRYVVYEDLPYGRHPAYQDARRRAFSAFIERDWLLMPTELPAVADVAVKAAAVAAYRSQVPLLEAVFDGSVTIATEAFWDLIGAPPAQGAPPQ